MGGASAKTYMGWWGSIGSPKQKGVTSYSVSPYAQKPLNGIYYNAVFNTFRRVRSQFLYIAIPAAMYWTWWVNCRDYNEYLYTKAGKEELERVNV
ncbi:ubiquinol--cytochrome-c reductase subunit 8 LALA0_S11e04170g [Lachancea lanzarotensis]|uniref:Cytochrome b-c1 complex subunit 8 n=1 Tax=Lachancea lanzarotensis TaxID=1245769 RepID=A0A0C7MWQ7_9SACH|nr:uncharacterized protein LALA0_S11e04170g [Lachancea lanzarotensis]CEP64441.1 LALA0S11e04170g1_1 [Lachancea lanzarotensis]